jgi:hypothetical protein
MFDIAAYLIREALPIYFIRVFPGAVSNHDFLYLLLFLLIVY